MAANPIDAVGGLANSNPVVKADLVSWAKARVAQRMADAAEVNNTVLTGQLLIFIQSLSNTFYLDAADTTSADNGTSVIVSADGKRYKPFLLAVQGPGSSGNGNIAIFSGTTGKILADGGKGLPSGAVVGTTDTQTLTNKTINGANNTLSIREADLSFTDITTANVSTTKHGLTPKLSNVATQYLDGTGNWSTPGGGGDATNVTFTATGTGATSRTVAAKLEEVLHGKDFGIVADGSTAGLGTDNTTAFNNFMAACKAGNYKGELPRGTIRLASKPNDIDFPWDLSGKGIVSTTLLRDYNGSGLIGCLEYVAGSNGAKLSNLSVQSSSGKTAGSMIRVISSSGTAVSALTFENLWITTQGTDTQSAGMVFDGSAKTTAPTGTRDNCLRNVHIFGANGYSLQLTSAIGFSYHGGGVYAAGATNVAAGGIIIAGATSNKSQYIDMGITTCNGLNLTNCLDMNIRSAQIGSISGTSINNDGTCSFTQVQGHPSGTVVSNWVSSGIRRPSAAWATS